MCPIVYFSIPADLQWNFNREDSGLLLLIWCECLCWFKWTVSLSNVAIVSTTCFHTNYCILSSYLQPDVTWCFFFYFNQTKLFKMWINALVCFCNLICCTLWVTTATLPKAVGVAIALVIFRVWEHWYNEQTFRVEKNSTDKQWLLKQLGSIHWLTLLYAFYRKLHLQ